MSRQNRWLPLLALAVWANIRTVSALPVEEKQRDAYTKLLGSSVVTSVSVVTPDSRKVVPAHEPPASPVDLLRPDRFQFYTFNQNGEVVTKQMTEEEIQSLIAAGGGHSPMEIYEPMKPINAIIGETKVADVVQNVQNVLKGELSKPTTVMVSVPTIPGHATDEWSNILPSILSGDGDSASSKPESNSIVTQPDDTKDDKMKDKNVMSEEVQKPTNLYDTYEPQPAIIYEMEPHVHEPPTQVMLEMDYIDKHVRPGKPQLVPIPKPAIEKTSETSTPSGIPLKPWTTTTMPGFHIVMTEATSEAEKYPVKNVSTVEYEKIKTTTSDALQSQKWKPTMELVASVEKQPQQKPTMTTESAQLANFTNISYGLENSLDSYSEKPMIPVSVITADQVFTSTQKTKINERPIFQILSTISPSAVISTKNADRHNNKEEKVTTEKVVSLNDEKSDNISIVSETHSTSVKVPGHPEVKIPESEVVHILVAEKVKPIQDDVHWYAMLNHSVGTKSPNILDEKVTESSIQLNNSTSVNEISSLSKKENIVEVNKVTPNIVLSEESINKTSEQYSEITENTTISSDELIDNNETSIIFDTQDYQISTIPISVNLSSETTTEVILHSTTLDPFLSDVTTENEVAESELPVSFTEIPAIEKIIQSLNQPEEQNIFYPTDSTTTNAMTDLFQEQTSIINELDNSTLLSTNKVEETTFISMLNDQGSRIQSTTIPTPSYNESHLDPEILPTELADSLSSVISQVAETIPSIISDSQNFPLSELKSKNITITNDEIYETLPSKATTIYDPIYDDESTTFTDKITDSKETTVIFATETTFELKTMDEQNTFTTEMTKETMNDDEVTSDVKKIPVTTLPMDSTDHQETIEISKSSELTSEKLPDDIALLNGTTNLMTSPLYSTDSKLTTKLPENSTEIMIIHIDVTNTPVNHSQYNTETGKDTSESPLIRIQLSDTTSAINHFIENAPPSTGTPLPTIGLMLPLMPYSVPENVASDLIAGFPMSTTENILLNNETKNLTENMTTFNEEQMLIQKDNAIDLNHTRMDISTTEVTTFETTTELLKTLSVDLSNQTLETTEVYDENVTEMIENKVLNTTLIETTVITPSDINLDEHIKFTLPSMTTTEAVTMTNLIKSNKTKKPETPVVRIDVSPETTLTSLPPRIQLTDLPIIEISSTNMMSENPSLYNNDTYNDNNTIDRNKTSNNDTYNVTNAFGTLDNKKHVVAMLVDDEQLKDIKDTKLINETKQEIIVPLNDTININLNKNLTLKNTTVNKNTTQNSTLMTDSMQDKDKFNGISDIIKNIPEKIKINESFSTSTKIPMLEVTNMLKNESNSMNINDEKNKEELKTTTAIPMRLTPNKDDSYIKLGEHNVKETINKTKVSPTRSKPSNTKRPPTVLSTSKTNMNKVQISVEPTVTENTKKKNHTVIENVGLSNQTSIKEKIRPPINKLSTLIQSSTSPSYEKKSELATEISKIPDENKWTLIPQQIVPAFPSKIKQEPKDPLTSTIFPILGNIKNGGNDESHRTGSKPIALDAIQSAGLDDSVRHLDQDIVYFSNLCNELAFNFWTSANKGLSSSRSLALSPFGMTSMLAMIFLGARGPTSAQMNDLLKLDDVATFNPHLVFQNITDTVSLVRNQGIANAAFVRLLFADRIKVGKLMPFYKEQAQKFYEGFVAEVNFSTISDQVRRRTNLLIRKQTGGRIKDFVKTNTVPLRSPLAALSANVFQTNCNCSAASSEGRDGELYFAVSPAVRQRRLVPVPATVWRSEVLAGYEPGLDATAVALGGTERLVSTIFVIPGQQGQMAPGDTLDRLEQRLMRTAYRDKTWDKLLKVIVPRPSLELQLPKFSHRSVVNATAALKRMGLEELFSRHANLKGINGFGHDIHLADVLQMNLFSTCGDENISNGRHHVEIYPGTPIRNVRKMRKFVESETDTFDSTQTNSSEIVDSTGDRRSFELHMDEESKNPRLVRNWLRDAEVSEKPRLKLDRPFLYFVRHNPTGLILHMGRFNPRLLP